MSSSMKILVAYDGSEPSRKALDRGIEMATQLNGELTLITVTQPVCPMGITEKECGSMDELLRKQTEGILGGIKSELEQMPITIKTAIREGSIADEITRYAEENGVDTILIGSHGRHGAKRFFLGSVSARVASHAHCSVVIVK